MVFQMKNTDALENDIGVLRNTCDRMADEVTKITQGAGEDKVEDTFYQSWIHVKFFSEGSFHLLDLDQQDLTEICSWS